MPAPLFFAVPAAVGIGISKKAENKRKQAAANEYSQKYPLLDDLGSMESSFAAAKNELKNLNNMVATTAGAKRVKERNKSALTKWTLIMSGHIKDLKAGMNVASSQVAPLPAQPVSQDVVPPVAAPVAPAQEVVAAVEKTEGEVSAETAKKGVNWLLIGGVALGAFVIYKMIKK